MRDILYSIKDLKKSFGGNNKTLHALNGVDLDIFKGEIFGIIGLSGAGKSTLIRCLNMLEVPSSGQVLFDCGGTVNGPIKIEDMDNSTKQEFVDITKLKYHKLSAVRKRIGMIFQEFNLLSQRTVLGNVYLPLEISNNKTIANKQYAKELLELVGITDKCNVYPSTLSGGQKQRVAIARALVGRPKVLLCDEPTSALDPETTKGILKLLKDINKDIGVTIVIITHAMSVIERLCDRVAILDKGIVVESGSILDIFTNPKTQVSKDLILSNTDNIPKLEKGLARIIFDGNVSQPIISDIALQLQIPINISFAATKEIDNKVYGQMIVRLPENVDQYNLVMEYFAKNKISVEVV